MEAHFPSVIIRSRKAKMGLKGRLLAQEPTRNGSVSRPNRFLVNEQTKINLRFTPRPGFTVRWLVSKPLDPPKKRPMP